MEVELKLWREKIELSIILGNELLSESVPANCQFFASMSRHGRVVKHSTMVQISLKKCITNTPKCDVFKDQIF